MRSLIRWVCCRLGRHRWQLHEVTAAGVLVVIPRCRDCHRVDVDELRMVGWNRAARRSWSRRVKLR